MIYIRVFPSVCDAMVANRAMKVGIRIAVQRDSLKASFVQSLQPRLARGDGPAVRATIFAKNAKTPLVQVWSTPLFLAIVVRIAPEVVEV